MSKGRYEQARGQRDEQVSSWYEYGTRKSHIGIYPRRAACNGTVPYYLYRLLYEFSGLLVNPSSSGVYKLGYSDPSTLELP